jgi:hypothetical protein
MEPVKVEDLVAVAGEAQPGMVLGHLLWWMLPGRSVSPEEFKAAAERHGIPDRFWPRTPSPADVFRRATKALEGDEARDGGVVTRWLVPSGNLTDEEGVIERALVLEKVDREAHVVEHREVGRWEYRQGMPGREVRVRLDLSESAEERERLERAVEIYRTELGRYAISALRGLVHRLLDAMKAVRVRQAGVVYFVPREGDLYLRPLASFLTEVGGRADLVTTINGRDERELVIDAFHAHVAGVLDDLKLVLKDGQVTRGARLKAVEEAKETLERIRRYEELLGEHFDRLKEEAQLVTAQVLRLVEGEEDGSEDQLTLLDEKLAS